ncbi:hypothetical protein [Streptomyces radiopugnans]|uniref:Uncharacterized protein n=1 Tax=Streptomyces radiopugnans TaxID=403935 RepID=A0A1H9G7H2_9ACTN|nr:hypothetical protein [Streptomyces radiopugnans]SEQ46105.1 hypothetical protein SAMN05216481_108139 [Streptomyces radiopugnans]
MSGDGDLKFSKEALDLIAKGLNGAIDELKQVGGSETDSLQGAGFDSMVLTAMEAGHPGLAGEFEGFCEDWEWGVRALVMDANALAARLDLAAGMVHAEDRYWDGTFKVAANSFAGNPHLSEQEITQREWGELISLDNYRPDYSTESFRTAQQEMGQTWKDTARNVTGQGQGGFLNDLAMDAAGVEEHQRETVRDVMFGPSPEERAQQQAQQQGGRQGDGGEG